MPSLPPPLVEFLALYRAGRFWDSHEVLEGPWRDRGSAFYHGLILYASAWVHWTRGNAHGVRAQATKARSRLADVPSPHLGVDVAAIRAHCTVVADTVANHPDDWRDRVGPLPLRADPDAVRGDEPEAPR